MSVIVDHRAFDLPGRSASTRRLPSVAIAQAGLLALYMFSQSPAALADEASNGPLPQSGSAPVSSSAPVAVDVVSVTSLTSSVRTQQSECWQVLMTERQFLVNQANARPWLLRNIEPVSGATLGVLTGAYFAAHYLSARIWILPAALVGGAAGWMVGPLGIALGVGGSILGHALTHQLPMTIAGGVAGAAIGMALWHFLIPPPKPATPSSPTEIPVENFIQQQQCNDVAHLRVHPTSQYRVSYTYGGQSMSADLPYDPGNTLLVDTEGKPVVPAHPD
jgi:uncharacterized protein YcfJ